MKIKNLKGTADYPDENLHKMMLEAKSFLCRVGKHVFISYLDVFDECEDFSVEGTAGETYLISELDEFHLIEDYRDDYITAG